MNIELYLAFIMASAVLIVFPGPNVALIVANSLSHGPRTALFTVAGTNTAQTFQLVATVAGLASLLSLLAEGFEVLRWLGVAYLAYLGLRALISRPDPLLTGSRTGGKRVIRSGWPFFWQGFAVALTNPKTLFFFAAFFPQFIDPTLPTLKQSIVLAVTYLAIATVLDGGYALMGGRLRPILASARAQKVSSRITGSLLLTAAAGLALSRRGN